MPPAAVPQLHALAHVSHDYVCESCQLNPATVEVWWPERAQFFVCSGCATLAMPAVPIDTLENHPCPRPAG